MKIRRIDGETEKVIEEAEYEFLGFSKAEAEAIKQLIQAGTFSFTNPNPERFMVEEIRVDSDKMEITLTDKTGAFTHAIFNGAKYVLPEEITIKVNDEDGNESEETLKTAVGEKGYKITVRRDGSFNVRSLYGARHPHQYSDGYMCTGNAQNPEEFLEALRILNLDSLAHDNDLTDAIKAKIRNDELPLADESTWEVKKDD